jgi:hypothetical protein
VVEGGRYRQQQRLRESGIVQPKGGQRRRLTLASGAVRGGKRLGRLSSLLLAVWQQDVAGRCWEERGAKAGTGVGSVDWTGGVWDGTGGRA